MMSWVEFAYYMESKYPGAHSLAILRGMWADYLISDGAVVTIAGYEVSQDELKYWLDFQNPAPFTPSGPGPWYNPADFEQKPADHDNDCSQT